MNFERYNYMLSEMDVEKFKSCKQYADEMLNILKSNVQRICNDVIKKYGSKYVRILNNPCEKINPLDDYYLYDNIANYVNENGFEMKLRKIDNQTMVIDIFDENNLVTSFKFPIKLLYLKNKDLYDELDNIIELSNKNN